jgi:hypothetical protein
MTTSFAADTHILSSTVREPGQLLEVCRRKWLVSELDVSAVSPDPPNRNLAKRASIDEGATPVGKPSTRTPR